MKRDLPSIRVIRFKTRLSDRGGLVLRRFRLRDSRRLRALFAAASFHETVGAKAPTSACLLRFWRWLHRTFQWFYTINGPPGGTEGIIGFIGLYGIQGNRAVKLAIAFFNPGDRRRGYGRRALELLLDDFRRRAVVQAVHVDVSAGNAVSIDFFRGLDFQPVDAGGGIRELMLPLGSAQKQIHKINASPARRRPPRP